MKTKFLNKSEPRKYYMKKYIIKNNKQPINDIKNLNINIENIITENINNLFKNLFKK